LSGFLMVTSASASRDQPETGSVASETVPTADEMLDADAIFADSGLRAARAGFGFPTDDDSMKRAVEDTLARVVSNDPIGAPLSDEELSLMTEFVATSDERDALTAYMRANSDTAAGWVFNQDVLHPKATLQVTQLFPAEKLHELQALVPEGMPYEIVTVEFSSDEILKFVGQLDNTIHHKSDELGLEAVFAELKLQPFSFLFSDDSQLITLLVPDTEEQSDEQLTEQLNARINGLQLPNLKVNQTDPDQEASGRTDSPGEAKGGIRIAIGAGSCTVNASAKQGNDYYILTAGHCDPGAGAVYHLQSGGPAGTPYGYTVAKANQDGTTTTWARDYLLSKLPPGARGLASSYVMVVGSTTGIPAYVQLLGTLASVESSSTYVCYEGASSLRSQILASNPSRTLCGWYAARTSFGRIQINVRVCQGDSGGTVRNGSVLYGIVSRLSADAIPGTNCAEAMSYTRIQSEMSAGAFSVVLGEADTSMLVSNVGGGDPQYDRCVSASNTGVANGTPYLQWGCIYLQPGSVEPHPAQSFRIEPVPGAGNSDTYRLVRMDGATKTCLSVDGGSAGGGYGDGALLLVWGCIGITHPLQSWRFAYQTQAVDGYFNMISVGSGKCISVPNTSTAHGVQLIIWGCISNHVAQKWRAQ